MQMALQPLDSQRSQGTILYIHGGGLFFGTPHDLPQPYVRLFEHAGYDLIPLGYPLAPEHTLPQILDALEAHIARLLPTIPTPVILFGRSAGAFLALQLEARAIRAGNHLADAIISLYGYADMTNRGFSSPSAHYAKLAPVPDTIMDQQTMAPTDFDNRFLRYVGHRQRGTWVDAVLGRDNARTATIEPEVLSKFPPTFLAASVYDPDVPFGASKALAAAIPSTELVRLYDTTDHDFDRDTANPLGMQVYQRIIGWLGDR